MSSMTSINVYQTPTRNLKWWAQREQMPSNSFIDKIFFLSIEFNRGK